MAYQLIVVRRNMLAELYGAHLWATHTNTEIFDTSALTEMTPDQLEKIRNKNILIVGGYFKSNMKPILAEAKEVTVFFNTSDLDDQQPDHKFITAEPLSGFLSWTIQQLGIVESCTVQIAKYLDEYLYGYPSEESLCFQNGVYTIDKPSDLERLLTIQSNKDIESTIAKGKKKRVANLRIAQQRLEASKQFIVYFDGKPYPATVAIGDSPIVDSCILLAQQTGIGILFRYNLAAKKTFLSCRTTKESGIDAGHLMKQLVNGGGSVPMGGGSINELLLPHQLLQ
jgi:hypothetical protein